MKAKKNDATSNLSKNLNISVSKKGLIKFGKVFSVLLALGFVGFFFVQYVIPAFANPGTVTIKGDLPQVGGPYFLRAYNGSADDPCPGAGSLANTSATGDGNYNDGDDYTLAFTYPNNPDIYLYVCTGETSDLVLTYHKGPVNDDSTYQIDVGRIYGSNVHIDLLNKYPIICDDLNGNELSSQDVQISNVVTGYTQFYAKDENTSITKVYVLIDTNGPASSCAFDSSIIAGKKITFSSAESYGVYTVFAPDTKVTGDLLSGADLNNAKFEVFDSSSISVGLATEAFTDNVANPDGNNLNDDYTIYYDKPGSGSLTLNITSASLGVTTITGLDTALFDDALGGAGAYDFIEHVTDAGDGVPSDISSVQVTCNVNGAGAPDDSITALTSRHDTYLYDMYMPLCSGTENILFNVSSTTVYTWTADLSVEGDDARDVAKVSGGAHSGIEAGNNDPVTVYNNNGCTVLLSSETVNPSEAGATDYAQYFYEDGSGTFYIKVNKDGTYATCGNAFTLASQAATRNLNVQLNGTVHSDILRVGVDRDNDDVDNTGAQVEAYTTNVPSGVYYLYVDSTIAGASTDELVFYTNAVGGAINAKLDRTHDLTIDEIVNVGRVTGNLHANLKSTHAGDAVRVYSDNACASELSSKDLITAGGATYTQYYEQTGASTYLKVSDENADGTYTSCGQVVTWGVYGDSQTDHVDVLVDGSVPDAITAVKLDVNQDGSVLIVGNVVETAVDSYKIYFEGDTTTNLQFYVGASKVLELSKNLGASTTVNVAEFSGNIHDSFSTVGGGTIEVWDDYTNPLNKYSSNSTITEAATDTYTVYFEDTGAVAVDLKLTDESGYVSWINDAVDYADDSIDAGDNMNININFRVTGTVPANTDRVTIYDPHPGAGESDPWAVGIPATGTGVYRVYVVPEYVSVNGNNLAPDYWDSDSENTNTDKVTYKVEEPAGTTVFTYTTNFETFTADKTFDVVKVSGTVPTTDVTLGQGATDYVFARDASAEHCNVAVDNAAGESRATIGDDDGTGTYDIYFMASTPLYLAFCHSGAAGVDPDYQTLSAKNLAAGTDYTLNLSVITGKMDVDFGVGASANILVYDNFLTDQVGGTVNTAFDGAAIKHTAGVGDYYVYFEQGGTAAAKVALTDENSRTESNSYTDVAMKITDGSATNYVYWIIGVDGAGTGSGGNIAAGEVITLDLLKDLTGTVPDPAGASNPYVIIKDTNDEYCFGVVVDAGGANDGKYRMFCPTAASLYGSELINKHYVLEINGYTALDYDTTSITIPDAEGTTFDAVRITGNIDASFVSTNTYNLLNVYDTWPLTTLLSSNSTTTDGGGSDDTYDVYFRLAAGVTNVDLKMTDGSGKVSWRLNVDNDNTNGATLNALSAGKTVNDLNLIYTMSGTVPIGVYSFRLSEYTNVPVFVYTLAIGVTNGAAQDTFKVYYDTEAQTVGTSTWNFEAYDNGGTVLLSRPQVANKDVNFFDGRTFNVARVYTAAAVHDNINDADDRYAVCNNIGTTPCEATAAELSSENVFGVAFTAGTAQYFEVDGTVGIVLEIKEETDNYYSYARLDSVVPGASIPVTLDALLSGDTATVPQAVDLVWIDDTGTGNTNDAGGHTLAEYAGDTLGDGTYKIYYNDALNSAALRADTARDVDAGETLGTGVVLTMTKTLANPDTWYVGSAYGATHANLDTTGTDVIEACAEDDDYTNGVLCTGASIVSSATVNPFAAAYPGPNDYSVYFEMDAAGGNNWIKVTDDGATVYTMYAIVVTSAGDRDIVVNLDALFSGEIREAFDTSLKINGATIRTYSLDTMWTYNTPAEAAEPSNTKIGGFTSSVADGTFVMYGDDGDNSWDVKVSKAGYIRQNAYTNGLAGGGTPNMDDVDISQAGFNVNLASGVKVIVKEYVSNNNVTDATVSIYNCTGTTENTCTGVIETCTQPSSGGCTRTGTNAPGNGQNGEYHFSGIADGRYIQARIQRNNYTTIMDPNPSNPTNPTYLTGEVTIQPDGLATNYTYFISNVQVNTPSLTSPGTDTFTPINTTAFSWSSVENAAQYQFQIDNDNDFSSPANNTNVTATTITTQQLVDGTYNWRVRAFDSTGVAGSWSEVRRLVIDATVPSVSITGPPAGLNVTGPFVISATATDATAGIAYVEFYNGTCGTGTLLGVASATPYQFAWATNPADDGVKDLCAKAYDRANNYANSPTVSIRVDNTAPTASITGPTAGQTKKGIITVETSVSDGGSGIEKVEFYIDGALAATNATSPYTYNWDTTGVGDGPHSLMIRAHDYAGNKQESNGVNIIVDNGDPESIVIVTPTINSYVNGTVTIEASVADSVAVQKVDFYNDSILFGTKTSAPWTVSWNTREVSDGTHSLTAQVADNAGNVQSSTMVNVTVDNNNPTAASITYPTAGMNVSGTFNISATGSDDVGISKIEFWDGTPGTGTLLGDDSTSPYSIVWTTTASNDGSHTIYARVIDHVGKYFDSTTGVSITVDNTKPIPTITSPTAGQDVNGTITVTTTITESGSGLQKVELLVDGALALTNSTPDATTTFDWNTNSVGDGSHMLSIKAYDNAGNYNESTGVAVDVFNQAPLSVAITTPANNTYQTGTITIVATASAVVNISKIEFYNDTILIDTDNDGSDGWSVTWATTAVLDGYHTLTAKAYDNVNNVRTSVPITILVDNNVPNVAPSLYAPSATGYLTSNAVTWNWTAASDGSGSGISYYQIQINSTPTTIIKDDTTTATSYTYYLADGTYSAFVRAIDKVGLASSWSSYQAIVIDTVVPTITVNAPHAYGPYKTDPGAVIDVDLADSGSLLNNFEYKINANGTWTSSATINAATYTANWSVSFTGPNSLEEGTNTIYVRAYDNAGNVYESPETVTMIKDTIGPGMSIITPTMNSVSGTSVSVTVLTTEYANCRFKLESDAADYATMTDFNYTGYGYASNLLMLSGLTSGTHTVYVKCQDLVGNTNNNSVGVSWIVDTSRPVISQPLVNGNIGYPYANSVPTISNVVATSPLSIITSAEFHVDSTTAGAHACTAAFAKTQEEITCNLTDVWGDLSQGQHNIFIDASNANGPSAFAVATFYKDTAPPLVMISDPGNESIVGSRNPTISFVILDNAVINTSSINISLTHHSDETTTYLNFSSPINPQTGSGCIAIATPGTAISSVDGQQYPVDQAMICTYYVPFSENLTDNKTYTMRINVSDMAGNKGRLLLGPSTSFSLLGLLSFGGSDPVTTAVPVQSFFVVNTTYYTINGLNASLTATDTNGMADDTYTDGWSFTFNISTGIGGNAVRFRMDDWTDSNGNTIPVFNNTKMVYYDNTTGAQRTYWVKNDYDGSQTIYKLQDLSAASGTQGNITVYVKIPVGTVAGSYSTTYRVGLYPGGA